MTKAIQRRTTIRLTYIWKAKSSTSLVCKCNHHFSPGDWGVGDDGVWSGRGEAGIAHRGRSHGVGATWPCVCKRRSLQPLILPTRGTHGSLSPVGAESVPQVLRILGGKPEVLLHESYARQLDLYVVNTDRQSRTWAPSLFWSVPGTLQKGWGRGKVKERGRNPMLTSNTAEVTRVC